MNNIKTDFFSLSLTHTQCHLSNIWNGIWHADITVSVRNGIFDTTCRWILGKLNPIYDYDSHYFILQLMRWVVCEILKGYTASCCAGIISAECAGPHMLQ